MHASIIKETVDSLHEGILLFHFPHVSQSNCLSEVATLPLDTTHTFKRLNPICCCAFPLTILYLSPPALDLYFINNTPELVGGSVSAEFAANRPGLEISCHLKHLDEFGFKQDCKLEDTHMTCGSMMACPYIIEMHGYNSKLNMLVTNTVRAATNTQVHA